MSAIQRSFSRASATILHERARLMMAATKSGANWLMDLPSIHLSCQNKARRPLPTTTDVDASNIDPFMDLRGALRLGDERDDHGLFG
jgi:hypothetical protein